MDRISTSRRSSWQRALRVIHAIRILVHVHAHVNTHIRMHTYTHTHTIHVQCGCTVNSHDRQAHDMARHGVFSSPITDHRRHKPMLTHGRFPGLNRQWRNRRNRWATLPRPNTVRSRAHAQVRRPRADSSICATSLKQAGRTAPT